ncbi:hypothetical protein [Microbacterium neimengense]
MRARLAATVPYLVTVACVAAGATVACLTMVLFLQSVFGATPGLDTLLSALPTAAIGGALTALFVTLSTVPLCLSMGRRRVLFVVLSGVGPLVGWPIVGAIAARDAGLPSSPVGETVGGATSAVAVLVALVAVLALGERERAASGSAQTAPAAQDVFDELAHLQGDEVSPPANARPRPVVRVVLTVVGVASVIGGLVLAAHGAAYLLGQTAFLPWGIRIVGLDYAQLMIPSALSLVGGALLAFVGIGVLVTSFNLGRTRRR